MPEKVSNEKAEALLKKYRLGQCTPAEMEIIDRWYELYGHDDVKVLADAEEQAHLREEMQRNIHKRIGDSRQNKTRTGLNRQRWMDYQGLWKVAAVLLLAIAASFYYYSIIANPRNDGASMELISGREDIPVEVMIKSSDPVIYLADGSVVWLKGDSHLEYPISFNGNSRKVSLRGEAFFDVAADAKKPFLIHSTNFTTRVLGTSFNIRDHGNEDEHEVVVVNGKVIVSVRDSADDKRQELVLSRNKKAVYSPRKNILTESDVIDVPTEILNKQKLVFEEVKLNDIIKVVNAEYNINISLSHEGMNGCIITADLSDMSLDLSLEILSKAINATYDVDNGGNIVISGEGCPIEEN